MCCYNDILNSVRFVACASFAVFLLHSVFLQQDSCWAQVVSSQQSLLLRYVCELLYYWLMIAILMILF